MKKYSVFIILLMFSFISAQAVTGTESTSQQVLNFAQDEHSRSLKKVDFAHYKLHEGDHFVWESGVDMASGDTTLLVFDVSSSTKAPHMLFEFYGLTAYTLDVLVGGSYIRAPDAVVPFNNNQRKTTVTVMDSIFIVYNDSTLIDRYGTSIFPNGPISVGAVQKIGSTISRDHEIIWGLDSLVIFKITSDAASNKVSWIIPWYEHIDLE